MKDFNPPESPKGIREYHEARRRYMKEKDYIEHEVWVANDPDDIGGINWMKEKGESGLYFKATLRIPKPERKVTITEGELHDAIWTHIFDDMDYTKFVADVKEEIFGRGD